MRKKKYLAIVIAAAVAVCGIGGVAEAVKRTTTSREIRVYPASDFNYGWYSGASDLEGLITAEETQSVYLTGSETVSKVTVSEGEQVHVGDLLLTYDTTQTGINLEMQKLQKEEIELNIEVAERNLNKLNRTKPVSDEIPSDDFDGGDFGFDDGEEVPDSGPEETDNGKGNPLQPTQGVEKARAHRQLDALAEAWNASEKDAGGIDHPLKFLCEDGCVILPSFVNAIRDRANGKDLYFILEIREGNVPSGALEAAWVENAAILSDQVAEDWQGVLRTDGVFSQKETAAGPESAPDPASGAVSEEESGASSAESKTPEMEKTGPERSGTSGSQAASVPEGPGAASGESEGSSAESEGAPAKDSLSQPDSGKASVQAKESEKEGITGVPAVAYAATALPLQAYAQIKTVTFSGSPVVLALGTAPGADAADAAGQTDGRDTASFTGVGLLTGDLVYTKDELDAAKKDMRDQIRDLRLDDREADLRIASAKKAFDEGEVRATMDGIVTKAGDPENPSNDGTAFLTVAGSEGQYVKGAVPELMLDQIHAGDSVLVTSWQSGAALTATIRSISDYPDESGQFYPPDGSSSMYPFTAYLDDGADTFTEGEWVQVSLQNTELSDSGDLYLWKAFIREENGQQYVWKMDEDGRLKKQEIRTGALSGEGYRILSGITEADYLAFPYGKGLKEGAKTKISEASELYE